MAKLRRADYSGPILQTVPFDVVEGPGPYGNSDAACNARYPTYHGTVADRVGVFCRQIHPHEGWFLHNLKGKRLYSRYESANGVWRTMYAMDPANSGWQHYFIARLRQYRRLGFDGFFFDQVELSRAGLLRHMTDSGGVRELASNAKLRRAIASELAAIRSALPGVPVWANLTNDPGSAGGWSKYLPYLNGVMVEDFALGWKTAALPPAARITQLENIQAALEEGKSVLLVAQGEREDYARRRFTLALAWALLPDGGASHVYYRYNDAGTNDYRQVWWSPLYALEPPAPKGPLLHRGAIWTRAYPQGHLRVNLASAHLHLPVQWRGLWERAGVSPTHGARRRARPGHDR
ncbi:MAG: putative glycoside hydrolase [Terriglobales bacterium]